MKLLTTGNPKIEKGIKKGFLPFILHLAPADLSGVMNTCPKASAGCKMACLNTAGRGGIIKKGEVTNNIQKARIARTVFFKTDREAFLVQLHKEIKAGIKKAAKLGLTPVFRLNGTSDLSWEKYGIFEQYPTVQFYDYTAVLGRKVSGVKNYHLTFSAKEDNQADVAKALDAGMNVAMVFNKIPQAFGGRTVFNGDETDLRFLDPKGVIVGLKAKGKAKKDTSGFVRMIPIAQA
jgi:hypothetical protein